MGAWTDGVYVIQLFCGSWLVIRVPSGRAPKGTLPGIPEGKPDDESEGEPDDESDDGPDDEP